MNWYRPAHIQEEEERVVTKIQLKDTIPLLPLLVGKPQRGSGVKPINTEGKGVGRAKSLQVLLKPIWVLQIKHYEKPDVKACPAPGQFFTAHCHFPYLDKLTQQKLPTCCKPLSLQGENRFASFQRAFPLVSQPFTPHLNVSASLSGIIPTSTTLCMGTAIRLMTTAAVSGHLHCRGSIMVGEKYSLVSKDNSSAVCSRRSGILLCLVLVTSDCSPPLSQPSSVFTHMEMGCLMNGAVHHCYPTELSRLCLILLSTAPSGPVLALS